jgi:hypothetical protein
VYFAYYVSTSLCIIISTGKQRTQKQEGTIMKVKIKLVETAEAAAVCRNCPTCTDETGHTMKGWLSI